MSIYAIEIIETLTCIIPVEADNEEEALQQASKMYKDEKIILNEEDYKEYTMSVYRE